MTTPEQVEHPTIDPGEYVDPDEFESYDDVDSREVDSRRGAPTGVVSQNGYSCGRDNIASYTVPGTTLRIALRKGAVSVVLLEFLRRYNVEVEPLTHDPQDLWGYAERPIRGSTTTYSNHFSGTGADHRATAHPLGKVGTFSAAQVRALDRLIAWFEGVLRHGKNYTGRKDEMHVEIDKGISEVERIAQKVRDAASNSEEFEDMDDEKFKRLVREALLDSGDDGQRKVGTNGGTSKVDPDNRIGYILWDMHKSIRKLHDAVFGLPSGDVSRDPSKSPSVLKLIRQKLGA